MIYDIVTNTVHPTPYAARGICIQREAPDLPEGFRLATEEEVLAAFPPPPVVEVVPEYSKLKIVEMADAMGKLADLESMLSVAPIRVRMRWQTAVSLMGDDPDLLAMVGAMQQAWQLTDEQRVAFLEQCKI